jgi:hypothetical protein
MRSKYLVICFLPLLIGVSSCSGTEAKCKEGKEGIEESSALIKQIEDQIKEYESSGAYGAALADALRPDLNELKDLQRAAIEELRELGCE